MDAETLREMVEAVKVTREGGVLTAYSLNGYTSYSWVKDTGDPQFRACCNPADATNAVLAELVGRLKAYMALRPERDGTWSVFDWTDAPDDGPFGGPDPLSALWSARKARPDLFQTA